jgi:uroporphyrin-III C-methyltransferase
VVRLKGGDPFIFGRGGEELEVLAEHGIAFDVVPGITAASGASCYAGIPLTHRDHAQSCIFTTGHLKDDSLNLDWPTLARPHQTVVVYMGLAALPAICASLIAHGQRADMPVAVIERGTQAQQRVITGTLTTIATLVSAAALQSPSLIIIGDVVKLHQSLRWFGEKTVDELEMA